LNVDPPVQFGPLQLPNTQKYDKLTYKGSLDYQVTDNIMVYGSVSRGYKSGNFNLLTYSRTPVDPEILDAYEVGFKAELFERRLRLNGAYFHYDIKGPQVLLIRSGLATTLNAGAAETDGAELEAQAVLAPGLKARAAVTYLKSRYTDFANAPSGAPNPLPPFGAINPFATIDAKGNPTPRSPKFTYIVGADYTLNMGSGDILFSVDYFHSGKYFFEPDLFLKQRPYGLLNGLVKYRPSENFAIGIYGKNLTKEKYAVYAVSNAGAVGYTYNAGAPRTYGVSLDLSF
jgi:iron complex outermembrane receptor protein